jgi:nucleoside-diphosphate-sugar epimerase
MSGPILITGANGYLGSHCVEKFARTSEREIVAAWHFGDDRLVAKPPSHVHYEQCDLTDRVQVGALFRRWKIEKVLHAAALLPDGGPDYLPRAVQSNIAATANLVQCAAEGGCAHFVYCSTISVYGRLPCPQAGWDEGDPVAPSTVYGWSKYAGEECVRLCGRTGGFSAVSVRLAGIHGRGRRGGVVFQMARAALSGQPLVVNNPTGRFQLLFLDDAVHAIHLAVENPMPESFGCINVASQVFPSLRQMGERIVHICGSKSEIQTGTTSADGDQVMNTGRMRRLLEFVPSDIEPHVRQIRHALEGTRSRYA